MMCLPRFAPIRLRVVVQGSHLGAGRVESVQGEGGQGLLRSRSQKLAGSIGRP